MAQNILLLVGPALVGSLVAYLCFGAFLVQLVNYALNPLDGNQRPIHALVVAVFVAEIGGVIILTEYAWRVLCLAVVDKKFIYALSDWSAAAPIFYGYEALLVQCFFAWQILSLSKGRLRYVIPTIIVAISLAQFSSSIAISVQASYSPPHVRIQAVLTLPVQFSGIGKNISRISQLRPTVLVQRTSALAADFLITAALTYLLWRSRSATSLSATRKLLNGLIINVLENAGVTTLFVALSLSLYLAFPKNNLHQAFQQTVGGLYANVLMASLNGRVRRRQAQSRLTAQGISIQLEGGLTSSGGAKSPEATPPRHPSDPDEHPMTNV